MWHTTQAQGAYDTECLICSSMLTMESAHGSPGMLGLGSFKVVGDLGAHHAVGLLGASGYSTFLKYHPSPRWKYQQASSKARHVTDRKSCLFGAKWVETGPFELKIGPIDAQSLCGACGTTADHQIRRGEAKKTKRTIEDPPWVWVTTWGGRLRSCPLRCAPAEAISS